MVKRPSLHQGDHNRMASKPSEKVNENLDAPDAATQPFGGASRVCGQGRAHGIGGHYGATGTCSVRSTAPSTPTKSRWKEAGSTRTRRMPDPGNSVPDS